MFGSSIFNNDPFFAGQHEQMRQQMSQMFQSSPFGNMGQGGLLALPGQVQTMGLPGHGQGVALPHQGHSDRRRQQQQHQQAQQMQLAGRGMFMDPFAHFDNMFTNMRSMMTDMHRSFDHQGGGVHPGMDPNTQYVSQSSVTHVTNIGSGAPKVYSATSSTRQGPGGVRETRRTVRDSDKGVEKCAVGHHINERGHIIERSRNTKNGEQEENQEYLNLDEEEASQFDHEYQDKWRSAHRGGIDHRRPIERSRHHGAAGDRRQQRALPSTEPRPRKTSYKHESQKHE